MRTVFTISRGLAEADWAHEAVEGATGPTTVVEIEAALRPVARESAIELMVNLAPTAWWFLGRRVATAPTRGGLR